MQTTELDPRDAILQAHAPAVIVPKFGNFPDLDESGHRYLVAADGLWIEVSRPWLHLRWPVAMSPAPLPYGEVISDEMQFGFDLDGAEFRGLMHAFAEQAAAAMPNECAAWFVWNDETHALEYRPLITTAASPGGVNFHRPRLLEHEYLAVDVHSHGALQPFFSETDDEDDAGEVKLSMVIGNVGTRAEDWRIRLCAHGLFVKFEAEDAE